MLMDDLLLKDYEPRPTIVVDSHLVERPKFPAVDAHNHLGFRTDAFGYARDGETGRPDASALIDVMDRCDIRAMANLTGWWGDVLRRQIDRYEGAYPGRFY